MWTLKYKYRYKYSCINKYKNINDGVAKNTINNCGIYVIIHELCSTSHIFQKYKKYKIEQKNQKMQNTYNVLYGLYKKWNYDTVIKELEFLISRDWNI